MTALSDALAVAQTRAVAAVSKAYVAAAIDSEQFAARLAECGVTDPVDTAHLIACLDVARELGSGTASVNSAAVVKEPEPASESQWGYLRKLADEKGYTAPEPPLTKEQASEAISSLKAGSYDPDKWLVPF